MFHVSRTLKNGPTALARQVLNVTGANGAPSSVHGSVTVPMVPRGVWQNIDAVTFTTLTKFDIGFWWWYESAELWVLDTSIGTAGYVTVDHTDNVVRIPILNNDKSACADGLYIEVANLGIGANPIVWLQGQQ